MATSPSSYIFDLGPHKRTISTHSKESQAWFDFALNWTYAFNHEEAILCCEEALKHDPDCAMAHWCIAYCNGPNYNNMDCEVPQLEKAYEQTRAAKEALQRLGDTITAIEKGLIEALEHRYAPPDQVDTSSESRLAWDKKFSRAMKGVYDEAHATGSDADVAALYAESMMNLRPWALYEKDGSMADGTKEILRVLNSALELAPNHPGLLHMYIHAVEMSPSPGDAVIACDALRGLAPDAGHLLHMPSHIDVLVGDYERAIVANDKAVAADMKYLELRGANNFYTLYRCHDYHLLIYAAMFDAQYAAALKAARACVANIPMRVRIDMADWVESFLSLPLHVFVRFGKWREILEEAIPDASVDATAAGISDDISNLYCVTKATYHYTRSLAHAALRDVASAEREAKLFEEAFDKVPESRTLFNNKCRDTLAIGRAMVYGELAYRRGNYDVAFTHLTEAVRLDDALPYDEPWGWMQPARHALAALKLEQGFVDDAAVAYRQDLKVHPNNPWALHGLAECVNRSQQPGASTCPAADEIQAQFVTASKRADVKIVASCMCRLSAIEGET